MKIILKSKSFYFILVILCTTAMTATALSLCNAKDVKYNAEDTNWNVETVSDALNDLYTNTCSKVDEERACKNVAEPVIKEDLIPVTLAEDGIVTMADTTKNWYNYCEKRWANAAMAFLRGLFSSIGTQEL